MRDGTLSLSLPLPSSYGGKYSAQIFRRAGQMRGAINGRAINKKKLISLSFVVARGARSRKAGEGRRGGKARPAVLDFVIGEDKNDGLSSVG